MQTMVAVAVVCDASPVGLLHTYCPHLVMAPSEGDRGPAAAAAAAAQVKEPHMISHVHTRM